MLPIHFAPLQGYTDCAYRNAHADIFGGVDCYYTPFIRLEHGEIRNKDMREALPENDLTEKTVPQIIVRDGDEFRILVEQLQRMGHKRIDVNMGCPFPLQTKKGRGAGLLSHPEKVKEVLDGINANADVDFSIKMRLGYESAEDCFNLLPLLNETSLTHITMHPRMALQQYKGEPDMNMFGMFLEQCQHNVIYNGDILSLEDISRIERDYPGVKGIMIGRGMLKRPSLAEEYGNGETMDEKELLKRVMRLHDRLLGHYESSLQGESHLLMKMKTFWEHLETVIGHKKYKAIKKAVSMAKYNVAIAEI